MASGPPEVAAMRRRGAVLRGRERRRRWASGGGVAGEHLRPAELVQQHGARRLRRALLERAPQPVHGALRRGARDGVAPPRRRASATSRRSAAGRVAASGPRRPPARARSSPAAPPPRRARHRARRRTARRTASGGRAGGRTRTGPPARGSRCASCAVRDRRGPRLVEARDRRGVGEGAAVEDGHGARRARRASGPSPRDATQDAVPDVRDRGATHRVERVAAVGLGGPRSAAARRGGTGCPRSRARTRRTARRRPRAATRARSPRRTPRAAGAAVAATVSGWASARRAARRRAARPPGAREGCAVRTRCGAAMIRGGRAPTTSTQCTSSTSEQQRRALARLLA